MELIGWYEGILADAPKLLNIETAPAIRRMLEAPMDIRGYGPVKDKAIDMITAEVAELRHTLE